ncbi:hypothetical protein PTTG_04024 [Puccinia triticina 1-1 BBBD Race 1]|uniref:Uncharacterized protein n=1 Tax=Puccinia triticina (isolate 1-1 / race 1 (BBBD)) TaxID=630390 RepID=A0A0C4ET95_PUCT1|nr:hypothetical protein PTTG_04024 [Puccinia triticina 1-1 BBBD Race 1]
MAPNDPSHTPSSSPPSSPRSVPHVEILQARAARASSIHTLESTNPPSLPANTSPKAPQLLAPPSATAGAVSPDSPPSRPRATLCDTFPKNPLWEEAVFPATAVLKYVGAFCDMYCNLLHLAVATPAQRRCRHATFLAGISQLAERLELAVIFPADERTQQARHNLDEALRKKPHPAQPTTPELRATFPAERTRCASHSTLP